MPLTVFVPGIPQPQGSARAFVIKGKARITSANPRMMSWRQDIVAMFGRREPVTFPVAVYLNFRFPRPKSHYKANGELKDNAPVWHTGRPDLDKLARAVCDALTVANVFRDDSQVVDLKCWKHYTLYEQAPGVQITVRKA